MKIPFFPLRRVVLCAFASGGFALPLSAAPSEIPGYEIVRLGRGHLNRLTLAATIEGKKGLFVVDTGAGHSFIGNNKYSFLLPGPDRQLPAGVPKTTSVNGTTEPVGYARDFHVGNSNLGALGVCIAPQRYVNDVEMLYQKDKGHDYDGYIGEDILRRCNAILDAGRMILYLNVDPHRRFDPGRSLVAAGWTRVPMTDVGLDFAVECRLGDMKVRLLVDTGSPFTIFDKGAADGSHFHLNDVPMRGGVVATRQQEVALIETDRLTIGNYLATNVHLASQVGLGASLHTNYNESFPLAGLLGGDVLSKHNAIIDVGNRALYLKSPSAAQKP